MHCGPVNFLVPRVHVLLDFTVGDCTQYQRLLLRPRPRSVAYPPAKHGLAHFFFLTKLLDSLPNPVASAVLYLSVVCSTFKYLDSSDSFGTFLATFVPQYVLLLYKAEPNASISKEISLHGGSGFSICRANSVPRLQRRTTASGSWIWISNPSMTTQACLCVIARFSTAIFPHL